MVTIFGDIHNLINKKKPSQIIVYEGFTFVETAGIEPASGQELMRTSTCLVRRLNLTTSWQPDKPPGSDSGILRMSNVRKPLDIALLISTPFFSPNREEKKRTGCGFIRQPLRNYSRHFNRVLANYGQSLPFGTG